MSKEQCRDCIFRVNYKEEIRPHIKGVFMVCVKKQELFSKKDCPLYTPRPKKELPHIRTPY